LERLGHTVLPKRPALAPVLADLGSLLPLQGVRLDAGVTLWRGSQRLASSRGNLIFTQWGLNGPAVMDISHHISAHLPCDLELSLNLLAFFEEEFDHLLAQKRASRMPLKVFLGAFFPPKVSAAYLKNARLSEETLMGQVSESAIKRLIGSLKDTRLPVKGVRDFEYCQISAGGVPVGEVDPQTLESRVVKGLFLTGETLDVVGPCGGYNLQYAFSSGALAGRAAARSSDT
jgi:predicted Rossmann fold flavoprotein